jgi:hypothetical protein
MLMNYGDVLLLGVQLTFLNKHWLNNRSGKMLSEDQNTEK